MEDKIRKIVLKAEIEKSVDETEGRFIQGYFSTSDVDRYGDIVDVNSWNAAMKRYFDDPATANPIVLFNHNPNRPVGKVISYEIKEKGPKVKVEIVDDEIWRLIEAGVLKAFSWAGKVKYIPNDDGTYSVMVLDLLEISVVSLPANPRALFQVAKDLGIDALHIPEIYNKFMDYVDGELIDNKVEEVTKMTPEEVKELVKGINEQNAQLMKETIAEVVKIVEEVVEKSKRVPERKGEQGDVDNPANFLLTKTIDEMTPQEREVVAVLTHKWMFNNI